MLQTTDCVQPKGLEVYLLKLTSYECQDHKSVNSWHNNTGYWQYHCWARKCRERGKQQEAEKPALVHNYT